MESLGQLNRATVGASVRFRSANRVVGCDRLSCVAQWPGYNSPGLVIFV